MTTELIESKESYTEEEKNILRRLQTEIEVGAFYPGYPVPVEFYGVTTLDRIRELVNGSISYIFYHHPPNCLYGKTKGYQNHIFYTGDCFFFYYTEEWSSDI